MPRSKRIILPNRPHHITQRGNRRQQTFFAEADYKLYLYLLKKYSIECKVGILAYCLMPNHVHLILIPKDECGIGKMLSEVHRRYTKYINSKMNWTGCLWQGRYYSKPMKDQHLKYAIPYVELNPVRSELVEKPIDYRWSSAFHRKVESEFWEIAIEDDILREMI